jgi:diguanylate cyclase (GGDEF)-like protein
MRRVLRHTFRWRPSLLGKFALVSVLPIVALGVVLGYYLKGKIEERALTNARELAVLTSEIGIQPYLTPADVERGLTPAQIRALDRALRNEAVNKKIARLKIWNRDNRIVYSDARGVIGRRFPPADDLREAFAGKTHSGVSRLDSAENVGERDLGLGEALEVYVPLRFGPGTKPVGAFEMYLPYKPIAASISSDTRTAYLLLLAGLGLLYATLFRIVAGASKRLRHQAEENRRQALHDGLTDLPNRTLFHDRVRQALLAARRDDGRLAVMLIDLDRFKDVNDTLGHQSGDLLLQALGPRLRGALRESDTVARLGGDEFGVLLPRIADPGAAVQLAETLSEALRQPLEVEDLVLETEASIGIALFPEHGDDVDTLLRRADVAMYLAKEANVGIELYAPERDHYSPARLGLLSELRRAIEQGELVLHYQPKASLEDGRVCSVEALVRWQHPERGLLPPVEFVQFAEHTGLMRPLTLYILDHALEQCAAWRAQGLELGLAVNLSARDLCDAELPGEAAALLEKWALDPAVLELEVTESTILADPLRARAVLTRLSELGVRIAIDDFGSGYTSLGYLKRLPIDVLKIDKSFILGMGADESDAVIVRSAIDLGHNLGLEVVAEGVETDTIWDDLAGLGCDVAQGFYLARPMPSASLVGWLHAHASGGRRHLQRKDLAAGARHRLAADEPQRSATSPHVGH